ncbi:MAG: hypothetical protein ACK56I_01055, partial [bacterium]
MQGHSREARRIGRGRAAGRGLSGGTVGGSHGSGLGGRRRAPRVASIVRPPAGCTRTDAGRGAQPPRLKHARRPRLSAIGGRRRP